MKIIEKLSTYAALLGVIGAIGGGFYTWGQFNSRLDALEGTPPDNLKPLHEKDKALEKKFDEVLLYANEYKVDLIDRIKKVDDKIKDADFTDVYEKINEVSSKIKDPDFSSVYKEIGKIREEIAALDIPKPTDLKPIEDALQSIEKALAIVKKENEVQDAEIKEIKLKSNNPLAN